MPDTRDAASTGRAKSMTLLEASAELREAQSGLAVASRAKSTTVLKSSLKKQGNVRIEDVANSYPDFASYPSHMAPCNAPVPYNVPPLQRRSKISREVADAQVPREPHSVSPVP